MRDWREIQGKETSARKTFLFDVEGINLDTGEISYYHYSDSPYASKVYQASSSALAIDAEEGQITAGEDLLFEGLYLGALLEITGGLNDGKSVRVSLPPQPDPITGLVRSISFVPSPEIVDQAAGVAISLFADAPAYLVAMELAKDYESSYVDGDSLGDGKLGLDGGSVRLINTIDPNAGELFEELKRIEFQGRSAALYAIISTAAEGEAPFAERLRVTIGTVGARPSALWDTIELPIQARIGGLSKRFGDKYGGFGSGILFESSSPTKIVVDGTQWSPTDTFALQARVWIEAEFLNSDLEQTIFSKGSWSLRIKHDFSDRVKAVSAYFTLESGAVQHIAISRPVERMQFAWITGLYNQVTGEMQCWINADSPGTESVPGGGAIDTSASDLWLGCTEGDLLPYDGVAGEFRIWEGSDLTKDSLDSSQGGRIDGDSGNGIVAYWRGDHGFAVDIMFDYGPFSNRSTSPSTSPFDGVIFDGITSHQLAGSNDIGGQRIPYGLGWVDNIPLIPVAPNFEIFQSVPWGSSMIHVNQDGAEFGAESVHIMNLRQFMKSSPVGPGTYNYFPPLGLCRMSTAIEGQMTGTMWGSSPFKAGLYFDGVDDFVSFGTGHAALTAGTFTFECWIHPLSVISAGDTPRIGIVSDIATGGLGTTGTFRIYLADVARGPKSRIFAETANSDGSLNQSTSLVNYLQWNSPSTSDQLIPPLHVAFVVERSGDVTTQTLYLNGVPRDGTDEFKGTVAPPASPNNLVLGRYDSLVADDQPEAIFCEVRLWNTVRTRADVEYQRFRELRRERPLDGLVSYYPWDANLDPSTWFDVEPTGPKVDAAINGAVWSSGVTASGTGQQIYEVLTDRRGASIDRRQINIDDLHQGSLDLPVSLYIGPDEDSDMKTAEVIDLIRVGRRLSLVWDRSNEIFRIPMLNAPEDVEADYELFEWEYDNPKPGKSERGQTEYAVGYHRIYLKQDPGDITGWDQERKSQLADLSRYAVEQRTINATYFPLESGKTTVEGLFAIRRHAAREAQEVADIRSDRRETLTVPLKKGLLDTLPGFVIKVYNQRFAGGSRNFLIVNYRDGGRAGSLTLWG